MALPYHTGWVPDPTDDRDLSFDSEAVQKLAGVPELLAQTATAALPSTVDLRAGFPPVYNQLALESCTANAAAGLVQYMEQRAFKTTIQPSRLFIYKVTRNLLNETGDKGAYARSAMQAVVLLGAPQEHYWPYLPPLVDTEPPAFVYALANNYKATKFVRHDPPGKSKIDVLDSIKRRLIEKIPAMFGFYVFSSVVQAQTDGAIPFPALGDTLEGGHAVVVAGYDDEKKIVNKQTPYGTTVETTGAFLIRNSWGGQWGENGYGWLPYEYLYQGLATDWWSLLSQEYIDTGQFTPDSAT